MDVRAAAAAEFKTNYIQLHRFAENVAVRPHLDPGGMRVAMLTLGQERTIRVGGKKDASYYPPNAVPQRARDVSKHIPEEEIPMKHGDLLVFIGGNVIHSMLCKWKGSY
jgi:hypothetical protein